MENKTTSRKKKVKNTQQENVPTLLQAIERVVRMVGTSESTTAIKALCPPEVTYDDIRLVLSLTQQ